jgi:hypothetical protein
MTFEPSFIELIHEIKGVVERGARPVAGVR